jgi:hypothetical protein
MNTQNTDIYIVCTHVHVDLHTYKIYILLSTIYKRPLACTELPLYIPTDQIYNIDILYL